MKHERIEVFCSALLLVGASACAPPVWGPIEIEVGTGTQAFIPLSDGDAIDLIRGPQGGYHLWGAVRAKKGLDPRQVALDFHVLKNEVELNGSPASFRLTLVANGDYNEWSGLRGLIPSPDEVVGKPLVLRMVATDGAGRQATAERRVIPRGP